LKQEERIGNGTILVTDGDLKYIEFECLDKFSDRLIHCMSTRCGGVSQGAFSTLNLGFNRGDVKENVIHNFQRLCSSVGISTDSLVLTNQVHNDIVRPIDDKDRGKGFSKESDIVGVDGLVTATPGITMVTFHADCVPIFLYEPEAGAAALVHSGWRGTLKGISAEAVKSMKATSGVDASRIIVVIGPSIRKCCFEVGDDVYKLFAEKYDMRLLAERNSRRRWLIDLQGIIRIQLISDGVLEKNIHDSEICTMCRKDLFFSYRGDCKKTGSMAAFMQIKKTGSIK
jgi:hypothetical protein